MVVNKRIDEVIRRMAEEIVDMFFDFDLYYEIGGIPDYYAGEAFLDVCEFENREEVVDVIEDYLVKKFSELNDTE